MLCRQRTNDEQITFNYYCTFLWKKMDDYRKLLMGISNVHVYYCTDEYDKMCIILSNK